MDSREKVIHTPASELVIDEPANIIEEQEVVDELYIIEDKAVIFFVLSKSELEKLRRELGSSYRYETDYLFNNFTRQSKSFNKLLSKHNIQSKLISNKKILIKLKNGQTVGFNRIREDQIMGEIISDGIQDPIIEFGMFRNKELISIIEKYFQIENLGFMEEEKIPIQIPAEEKMNLDSVDLVIEPDSLETDI
ncbi:MAG: hypothetical protein DRJ10_12420 [Bacteroidetes bacterium]|nr:MAG: hypothetical protein DRJ10_12420 [Bacteroidota bacterium]